MKMIIGGNKVDAHDGKIIEVFNPATMELLDTVPSATNEDIEKALDIAQVGKKVWAKTPLHERCRILMVFADLVEKHQEEVATLLCKETGKTIKDARGELLRVPEMVRGYAERAAHLYSTCLSDAQPGSEHDIVFTRREPLGLIICIIPFNFPATSFAHKIAPALAMGNAIIVKPASDNPLTNIRLTELLIESGVPGNVAQVITGSGSTVGNQLIASSKIDAVSLTGSTEVGVNVAESAAKHLHHVMLELGGNDAMIVFEDANLDLAVKEVIMSRASCAGQICASTKRLIVQNTVKQQFTDMLVNDLGKLRVGNPLDQQMDMGCLINEKAAINVENQIKSTIEKGAVCLLGGKRFDRTFVEPTILVDVTADMDIAKDMEVFGPVFPIIGFDTFEEAVQIANSSRYGLMGAVMTRDISKAMKAAASMECGGVVINGSGRYRPAEFPFGGYKMSGLGREGISTSLEEMSQQKAIVLKGVL